MSSDFKEILRGETVYLDSNIVIYILDRNRTFSKPKSSKFLVPLINDIKDLFEKGEITIFTSNFVFKEIIINYYNNGNDRIGEKKATDLLNSYNSIDIDSQIGSDVKKYLKKEPRMSVEDIEHVLTAIKGKCNIFITNDGGINVPKEIKLVLLSDYGKKLSKDFKSTPDYEPNFKP